MRLHPATAPPAPILLSPTAHYSQTAVRRRAPWLRAAVYAGAIGFLLSFVPFGVLFGLPLAGWLAVRFYSRSERVSLQPPAGLRLGALAGFLIFGVQFLFAAVAVVSSTKNELRQALLQGANWAHTFNPDLQPEQFVTFVMTPQGAMLLVFVFLGLSVVLSGLGGLFSAVFSHRTPPL